MALITASLPTIKYEGKDWSGLTSANNLVNLFGDTPIKLGGFIDTIYKVNLQDDIISKVNEYPTLYIPDDREYQWMLMGADSKNIPLQAATDIEGNAFTAASTPGKYGERFILSFAERMFFQTHVIVGEKPDLYHLLVTQEGEQNASGKWDYEVELVTSDPELYIPYAEIVAGTRWSVDYSLSEQFMSDKGSDISFTSPFLMSNRISMIRKEHTVPGEMIRKGENEPVSFNWQYANKDGQTVTKKTWLNRLDWEFDKNFRREKAKLLFYGKGNQRADGTFGNLGKAGGEIKAGMGLREQISASNIHYYTTFNIETLVDFALNLSVGRLPEDQRNFVIGTGEHGLKMVSRAIETYAGANALSYGTENNRMNTIKGSTNKMSYNRPQFVKFADINGIRFEFIHIPWYDDPVRNKLVHPDGGTVESYRLTIMDFGTSSGNPNIQLVRVKGQDEVFGYIPGLRDPYSPGNKAKMMASGVDGYTIHRADWCGLKIHNPMRLGEWIPNIS
jgi:hypothetical protein